MRGLDGSGTQQKKSSVCFPCITVGSMMERKARGAPSLDRTDVKTSSPDSKYILRGASYVHVYTVCRMSSVLCTDLCAVGTVPNVPAPVPVSPCEPRAPCRAVCGAVYTSRYNLLYSTMVTLRCTATAYRTVRRSEYLVEYVPQCSDTRGAYVSASPPARGRRRAASRARADMLRCYIRLIVNSC
jgi:hypothetical protein